MLYICTIIKATKPMKKLLITLITLPASALVWSPCRAGFVLGVFLYTEQ